MSQDLLNHLGLFDQRDELYVLATGCYGWAWVLFQWTMKTAQRTLETAITRVTANHLTHLADRVEIIA